MAVWLIAFLGCYRRLLGLAGGLHLAGIFHSSCFIHPRASASLYYLECAYYICYCMHALETQGPVGSDLAPMARYCRVPNNHIHVRISYVCSPRCCLASGPCCCFPPLLP